jgi:cellulose 1,4-beta-cellobiosidase
MGTILKDISSAGSNVAGQFVVYDLPDRDCAALASNGEYSIADDGVTKYKAYIDSIHDVLVTYSTVPVILVIGKYLAGTLSELELMSVQSLIPSPIWLPT